jgi:phosphoribosylglycinamide formyltransferase-1
MKRLGILLSGRGSNFAAIARNAANGTLPGAEIALVISNRADAPGLEHARRLGLPALCLESRGVSRELHDARMIAALRDARVDLVCLAGYMRLLTREFIDAFPNRILNIHPSLLPSFPGLHAQRQALEYGVRIAGCTVHVVTEEMDAGPILAQACVPVLPGDTEETLSERILQAEHQLFTQAIHDYLANL